MDSTLYDRTVTVLAEEQSEIQMNLKLSLDRDARKASIVFSTRVRIGPQEKKHKYKFFLRILPRQLLGWDANHGKCSFRLSVCPELVGPDASFGDAACNRDVYSRLRWLSSQTMLSMVASDDLGGKLSEYKDAGALDPIEHHYSLTGLYSNRGNPNGVVHSMPRVQEGKAAAPPPYLPPPSYFTPTNSFSHKRRRSSPAQSDSTLTPPRLTKQTKYEHSPESSDTQEADKKACKASDAPTRDFQEKSHTADGGHRASTAAAALMERVDEISAKLESKAPTLVARLDAIAARLDKYEWDLPRFQSRLRRLHVLETEFDELEKCAGRNSDELDSALVRIYESEEQIEDFINDLYLRWEDSEEAIKEAVTGKMAEMREDLRREIKEEVTQEIMGPLRKQIEEELRRGTKEGSNITGHLKRHRNDFLHRRRRKSRRKVVGKPKPGRQTYRAVGAGHNCQRPFYTADTQSIIE